MFKILGAAVAAISLFATGASAATLVSVDFEGAAVGSAFNLGIPNIGFGSGIVKEDAGGKYLSITPIANDYGQFVIGGLTFDGPGNKRNRNLIYLASIDIYTADGGYMRPFTLPIMDLAAGWQTKGAEVCPELLCKLFLHGEDIRIDNVVFSYETTVLPEPTTWAMMILGFGAVGSLLRRRKVQVPATVC